jgi:hypothetical protein
MSIPFRSEVNQGKNDRRASGDATMPRMSINVANGRPIQALSLPFKIVLILGLVIAPVGRPTIRAVDAGSRAHSRRDSWRPEPLAAPATSTSSAICTMKSATPDEPESTA